MRWYQQVQFISAVPMSQQAAADIGTTVNGMWASPEGRSAEAVATLHSRGQRVLFSVPMIALTPGVYHSDADRHLLHEVCRDIDGNQALVSWYYWEPEPVYSTCIYSPVFRRYLLDRCQDGIDRGMDVVNLDEINTSIGLMNRKAGGSGFCPSCLARFRSHLQEAADPASRPADADDATDADLLTQDDEALRLLLKHDDDLYARYRRFHETQAFGEVVRFIAELREYAACHAPDFAITANLAYLGNNVSTHGALWGPMWGEHVDFVMFENTYRVPETGPHLLLPRGKFTAWYRLASGFTSRAPAWICPSIMVPRQLAGQARTGYYLQMFLEAYANGGRWGYNWWPGVDDQSRYDATVPARLKDCITFITANREFFEDADTGNDIAILYLDGSISQRVAGHQKYLALAQALAEGGYQYDVIYVGDGTFNPRQLDRDQLTRYKVLLIPEASDMRDGEADALVSYIRDVGGQVVIYAEAAVDAAAAVGRREDERPLLRFWTDYSDVDRQRILATVDALDCARVTCSDPIVNVIKRANGDALILHLVNYNYDAATDEVQGVSGLSVRLPWPAERAPTCTLLRLGREDRLECATQDGQLLVQVAELDNYGLLLVR